MAGRKRQLAVCRPAWAACQPERCHGATRARGHGAFIGDRYKTCRPVTRSASKERETARMIYERNPERLEADDAD